MTATTRTRLRPAQRREQLLELGVRLLGTRTIDELSIELLADEAGISRGLLYHYFGSKQGFHEAVVRHAAQALLEQTAPPAGGEPLERLLASITAYVDYVMANHAGYRSLVKAAAGGNEALRQIYEETLHALGERLFDDEAEGEYVVDTPVDRLVVRGWQAFAEETVLAWCEDDRGVTKDELLQVLAGSLPAIVGTIPRR